MQGGQEERVRALMGRIWPESRHLAARFVTREQRIAHAPVFELLRHGRATVTVALWLACFMNLSGSRLERAQLRSARPPPSTR